MTKLNQFLQTIHNEISHVHMSSTEHIQLLIVDVQILLSILYPYMFLTFTYDSSHAWCRNSVGHIIKFLETFFNLFDGSVIQFYIFKEHILIVVAPLHLQRHTTFTYYNLGGDSDLLE